MLGELFQKLLVAEKRVWRPGGFEGFQQCQLLVRAHGEFQNSCRTRAAQQGRLCKKWTQAIGASQERASGRGTCPAASILKHKAALSVTLCFKSHPIAVRPESENVA